MQWQSLTVNYPFNEKQNAPVRFFDFQQKTQQALNQFIESDFGSALVIKTETFREFCAEIETYLHQKQVKYVFKNEFDRQSLFGYALYLSKENRIQEVNGAIQQAEKGVLILNINALLLDITQWDKLKQALLFGQYQKIALNDMPAESPVVHSPFKLLLLGSREDIATLAKYDDSLYQFCQYTEIDAYLTVSDQQFEKWGNYIQSTAEKQHNRQFSRRGLNQFLQYYVRESESHHLLSISPTLLAKHLSGLRAFYPEQATFDDIQGYFDYLQMQSATLNQYVLNDMLNHQQYIETQEKAEGQINGLSVVEFDGIPQPFGEPIRISCNVQYGEGEIHDIERKVELGGNIHAKGILIAQSCLAHLLELPTQLPFSASLAFEQSYGEVDGDSSSLAIFCVLISALAKLPVPQSYGITGAIDQFGNVLSVGGVNQKIEGFFDLCEARTLTGEQGVIIPSACLSHLSLKPAVIDAVKAKQFHIWAVSDVFEACEILFEHPFYAEEEKEDDKAKSEKTALFELIHQHIEHQEEQTSGSIWQRICKWGKGH
ncbi:protease [Pasteurellaceae bacterium Macca]|nr:protease [Pasteurellaceae bacterium Macca]